MGKWTPEGCGVEEHPSRMSRMEGRHASVMAEPMRYRRPTVSDYNKQEGWGRRLRWLEKLGYLDSRNPGQLTTAPLTRR